MCPIYTFKNKNTDEEHDIHVSIAEMEEYVQNNPDMERVYTPSHIADPINIGVTRPPADFAKHVLGKVKQMPGARGDVIEKRWNIPKEI